MGKSGKQFQDMEYELSETKADWCKSGLGVFPTANSSETKTDLASAQAGRCKASDRSNLEICAALNMTACSADEKCHWGYCASAQQVLLQNLDLPNQNETNQKLFCDDVTASFCPYGQKPMICPEDQVWLLGSSSPEVPTNQEEEKYYKDLSSDTWTCGAGTGKAMRCACYPGEHVNTAVSPFRCTTGTANTSNTTGTAIGGSTTPTRSGQDYHGPGR